MTYLKSLLVLSVLCAASLAQDVPTVEDLKPKPKPNTTTQTPPTPPTPPPAPNTTTPATTTTAKPTTTIKPTPAPQPEMNTWTANFTNSNDTCFVVRAALQYEVPVLGSNSTIKINVPKDAQVAGECGERNSTIEKLVLKWETNNTVTITLLKNATKFEIANITATLAIVSNGNVSLLNISHEKPEFEVSIKNSYKCARVQTLNFTTESSNVTAASLHVSNLQFQGFRSAPNKEFSSAWDCDGINTPDVVPIVVGCVLAALVVIVLVAYLFGRRRCQARGYLSM